MGTILVVTGMRREARLATGAGLRVLMSGGRPERLRGELAGAVPASMVVSFGLAGGLDPELGPGALIVGSEVVGPAGPIPADPDLTERCMEALRTRGLVPHAAAVAGADEPALTPGEKRQWRTRTGAAAIDMESHIAAEFARRTGAPLLVLRAVADAADRALPALAAKALRPDGGIDHAAVLAGLLRRPGDLPALIAAARDSAAAFRILGRCAPLAGLLGGLGGADLR